MHAPTLDTATIEHALRNARIGHTVVALGSVASTMPVAAAAITAPTGRSGLVVTAEEQHAGRGRFGRKWNAPYGQALLMTVALKAPDLPQPPTVLPMLAAISVLEAIAECEPTLATRLHLKWPNDVLLRRADGSVGKVAGILLESVYVGEEPVYALIGMGVNVNQAAAAFADMDAAATPAGTAPTSLCAALGRTSDRSALLVAVCRRVDANLDAPARAMTAWRSHLLTLGRLVSVRMLDGGAAVSGRAVDVDGDGNLVVELPNGQRRHFNAGDVTLGNEASSH